MDIDDRWIDVDFTKEPQFVAGDLGRNPAARLCRSSDDEVPIIPDRDWEGHVEQIDASGGGLDRYVKHVFDQGQEGSCVGNATTQQNMVMQAGQFGFRNVTLLSPMSLYKRIGRSPSSGAMVDDALDEMQVRGVLPLDTAENRTRFGNRVHPATGYNRSLPDGWEKVAREFRSDERFVVTTTQALISCLLRGHPIVVGREGHSILYLRPVYHGGKLFIKYVNSWSEDWGEGFGQLRGGFGYDSRSQFEQSARWAFAIRTLVVPSWLQI
jgi:hypothetical protein